jgi:ABC-type glutathione transport system ATPase component
MIVRDVSLVIEEGSTIGLLGRSGSGKTTIARCLAGLLQPDAGTIRFLGRTILPGRKAHEPSPLEIQLLFQTGGISLDPMMSVFDALQEGLGARREKRTLEELRVLATALLASVGLDAGLLDRMPSELSGGQRQRIALARILAVRPKLLLLDEPTSALDALTRMEILSLLKTLQQQHNFGILLITHDVATAFSFCDRIAFLHDGTIVEEGTPWNILQHPEHPYTSQFLSEVRLKEG